MAIVHPLKIKQGENCGSAEIKFFAVSENGCKEKTNGSDLQARNKKAMIPEP